MVFVVGHRRHKRSVGCGWNVNEPANDTRDGSHVERHRRVVLQREQPWLICSVRHVKNAHQRSGEQLLIT